MAARLGLLAACATCLHCSAPDAPGNLVPRTVDQDEQLPQLTFNGEKFHVQTFGDENKPVVIFLHGGPGLDSRGLLELRKSVGGRRLEDDYFLVFWDQRGAGLSQRRDPAELDLDDYQADLDQLIDHFGGERKVAIVGHSWGGMYGALFSDAHLQPLHDTNHGFPWRTPAQALEPLFPFLDGLSFR